MDIVSFVFGIVAAVTMAFIALVVVTVVMTFRNKKDLQIRVQEEIHVREHFFNSVEKLREDLKNVREELEEKHWEAISHTDRRIDKIASRLNK